jgi:hypothetical protein
MEYLQPLIAGAIQYGSIQRCLLKFWLRLQQFPEIRVVAEADEMVFVP